MGAWELYTEPLKKRYWAQQWSLASLFWLSMGVIAILCPFFIVHDTYDLWVKNLDYWEQPQFSFDHSAIVLLRGAEYTTYQFWSTMPEVNKLVPPANIRIPELVSADVDDDYDGINDHLYVNITTPIKDGEFIYFAEVYLFYLVKTNDRVRMTMTGMTHHLVESRYPGQAVTINADLGVHFTNALPSVGSRTTYNVPVIVPGDLTSIGMVLPQNLTNYYALRNETVSVVHRVDPVWTPGFSNEFLISLNLRIPTQRIPYIPAVGQTLKLAWIQYLSVFIALSWLIDMARRFVFRYQIVPTRTTLDTISDVKQHQY